VALSKANVMEMKWC